MQLYDRKRALRLFAVMIASGEYDNHLWDLKPYPSNGGKGLTMEWNGGIYHYTRQEEVPNRYNNISQQL